MQEFTGIELKNVFPSGGPAALNLPCPISVQISLDQTHSVMRLLFNPLFFLNQQSFLLFLSAFLFSSPLVAEECTPPQNFEAVYYDHFKADYQWDFSADALWYEFSIEINGKPYSNTDLPGSATKTDVKFAPLLKHKDLVHAVLTKHCSGGQTKSASFDFIIIDDAIVYLSGDPAPGERRLVEPVKTVNENLVPAADICGLCEADFFRLEAGFYGPYGIAVAPSIGPIEQLRFLKTELCACIDAAIAAGILDENGGPGSNYDGNPFRCAITPYIFPKEDCPEKNKERNSTLEDVQSTLQLEVIPNPVTGTARISYRLSRETNAILSIYDATGRLLHTVAQQAAARAGAYQVEFDAGTLAPGFYYCQLQAEGARQVRTLVVLSH